ncbi:MAG: diacylglycerol/lipid kinase family protein, partial [Actinomycetota bacterium]
LGGDGSVHLVVNGLFGSGSALAVLPAGTGDDFAKAVGAGKLDAATRLLADPKTMDVDLIEVTAGAEIRRYINVAGTGFDSAVEETANAMRRRLGARGHYALATIKTLPRFLPAGFHIEIDGAALDLDAMLVVVGNSFAYGGGMRVLPQASVIDGELDVCVVSAMSKGAFLRAFPKVYVGKHATHPNVTMLRGREVKVEANRRMLVFADGERVGSLPAVFKVLPRALPVVVGPDAKAIR